MPWTDCTATSKRKMITTTLSLILIIPILPITVAWILFESGLDGVAVAVIATLVMLVEFSIFEFIHDMFGDWLYACNEDEFKKKLLKEVLSDMKNERGESVDRF